jgi:hypothetical protein
LGPLLLCFDKVYPVNGYSIFNLTVLPYLTHGSLF